MQLETFMGCDSYLGAEVIPHMSAGQGSAVARAKIEASLFSPKEFAFDREAGFNDPHVAEYAKLAALDSGSGNFDRSMEKLKSFLIATRDALKQRQGKLMTDRETQEVVDIAGRMNLIVEITQKNFPGGIPTGMANMTKEYMGEINDIVSQLVERRKSQFIRVADQYQKAMQFEEQFKLDVEEWKAKKAAAGEGDPGAPGGGAAGSGGEIVEKTAMQKYGPVAALAAGGLAAYLALR